MVAYEQIDVKCINKRYNAKISPKDNNNSEERISFEIHDRLLQRQFCLQVDTEHSIYI